MLTAIYYMIRDDTSPALMRTPQASSRLLTVQGYRR